MAGAVAAVGAWVTTTVAGALGTSAVATGVAAVAGTVAEGAVVGAVIGGATALVTGDNVLKGALHGGIVGGITAGAASTLGIITNTWGVDAQLASMGLEKGASGGLIKITSGSNLVSSGDLAGKSMLSSSENSPTQAIEAFGETASNAQQTALNTPQIVNQAITDTSQLTSPKKGLLSGFTDSEKAHMLGGAAQGGLQAIGKLGSSIYDAKSQEGIIDKQQRIKDAQKQASIPSLYKIQTQNTKIQLPDWWGTSVNAGDKIINNNPNINTGTALNPVV